MTDAILTAASVTADSAANTVALYALVGTIVASAITAMGTVVVALIQSRARERENEWLERENRELKDALDSRNDD